MGFGAVRRGRLTLSLIVYDWTQCSGWWLKYPETETCSHEICLHRGMDGADKWKNKPLHRIIKLVFASIMCTSLCKSFPFETFVSHRRCSFPLGAFCDWKAMSVIVSRAGFWMDLISGRTLSIHVEKVSPPNYSSTAKLEITGNMS